VVSSFEPVSHEAIRKGYHKDATLFSVDIAYREIIAVDETSETIAVYPADWAVLLPVVPLPAALQMNIVDKHYWGTLMMRTHGGVRRERMTTRQSTWGGM
jgi:hypothetical protein